MGYKQRRSASATPGYRAEASTEKELETTKNEFKGSAQKILSDDRNRAAGPEELCPKSLAEALHQGLRLQTGQIEPLHQVDKRIFHQCR